MSMSKKGGLRTALLAGACVVALGATAGSAAAAPACTGTTGDTITGRGASLQVLAQSTWISAYNTACAGTDYHVNAYRSGGSGGALTNWGFNGNAFTTDPAGGTQVNQYIASDDGPYATSPSPSISNSRSSLDTFTSRGAGSSSVVVLPVAQAAIAIIVHPPANCTLTDIDNDKLEQAFDGSATTWSAIGGVGSGCSAANSLTRVVRADSSGTTYQFKHYLDVIDPVSSPTWSSLQSAANNTVWPSGTMIGTASGGGAVVNLVNATTGSIGYANLADVKANGTPPTILNVQNDGITPTGGTYGDPVDGTDANCGSATYAGAPGTSAANQDWSGVYGEDPDVANTSGDSSAYPICTLTYEVAAEEDATSTGSLAFGADAQRTVKDYLGYVVDASGGQTAIAGKYYRALTPSIRAVAVGNVALLG
jgi:ABC-type phosphate transport system substrate-binding protein